MMQTYRHQNLKKKSTVLVEATPKRSEPSMP